MVRKLRMCSIIGICSIFFTYHDKILHSRTQSKSFLRLFISCRGILLIAPSLFGAAVRVPRIWSLNLISVIFCEAVALYGVIITIILIQKMKDVPIQEDGSVCPLSRAAGFAVMGSGMSTGFTNLVCG